MAYGKLIAPWLDNKVQYEGVTVYRDLKYGTRADLPDEGFGSSAEFGFRHRTGQNFDLYLPEKKEDCRYTALYVHGGSWSQRFDKDGGPDTLMLGMVRQGYCIINIDYQMQTDIQLFPDAPLRAEVNFDGMLRDIDAMVSYAAELLPLLGIPSKKLCILGHSAGAHLSSLYAYDQNNPDALGLHLQHRIPIGYVINLAGPADLLARAKHRNPCKELSPDQQKLFFLCRADQNNWEEQFYHYSPINLVCQQSVPGVLCYFCRTGAQDDGPIPVCCYTNLREKLLSYDIPFAAQLFHGHSHSDCFCDDVLPWILEQTEKFSAYL